uniref:Centromere protein I n=2 Tax=Sarcophilus harrisii TaxID=9305 RepID=A0A7N4PH28_SARHA
MEDRNGSQEDSSLSSCSCSCSCSSSSSSSSSSCSSSSSSSTSVAMSTREAKLSPVIPVIKHSSLVCRMRHSDSDLEPLILSSDDDLETDDYQEGYLLHRAFEYFQNVHKKGEVMEKHLQNVEDIAWKSGLAPESIDMLLDVALNGPFADAVKARMLKCLIPTTIIHESAVVKAFSKLCATSCSNNTKVVFIRWLIAMFDFIDHKEEMNALYGFIFSFLQDESMGTYISNLLYLLTRKENVKPFRVRKLLELQSRMGMQPYLQALLSLYKSYCPNLITITLPPRRKFYYKSSDNIWQAAVFIVKQRHQSSPLLSVKPSIDVADHQPQRKKWNSGCFIPKPTSRPLFDEEQDEEAGLGMMRSAQNCIPIEQLHTFSQLLENIQYIQLPSQMCSVLRSTPLLHYLNCLQDETVWVRLYYWMIQELKEGCAWYKVSHCTSEEEFKNFLDIIISAQCFLQEGFPSSEMFLYKSLPLWDGISCRTEYLQLLSWIPLGKFSEIKPLLYKSLAPIFFTSSLYHKCSVLYSLKKLVQNWLLWHTSEVNKNPTHGTCLDITIIALNSVSELIYYVGWLSTIALRLEDYNSFLLHFILDFFETVSDMYLNYGLPLVVMFPPGVFYPALITSDTITLNHLCYIMYRYRVNLTAAKENELLHQEAKERLKFNKAYQEFNDYVTSLVDCLWTSTSLDKGHYLYIEPEILEKTKIKEIKKSLNLINHPALQPYSVYFLLQGWPSENEFSLNFIQKKKWNWYLDYLLLENLHGLHLFMQSSLNVADNPPAPITQPDDKLSETSISESF